MSRVRHLVGTHPVVMRVRKIAETAFTPRVRVDLQAHESRITGAHEDLGGKSERLDVHDEILHQHSERLRTVEESVQIPEEHAATVEAINSYLPRLMSLISNSDGTARLLRREFDDLRQRFDVTVTETTDAVTAGTTQIEDLEKTVWELSEALAGHAQTQRWLMDRVESLRADLLNEIRFGPKQEPPSSFEIEIIEPAAVDPADGTLRISLGCGDRPLDGYANIDLRKLPGVDVVAPLDGLPVEGGSVAELYSANLLGQFPTEELRRRLMPYWVGLLRPGGVFRAVVPDVSAMVERFVDGGADFESFSRTVYGSQETERDSYQSGFTAESLRKLFEESGLTDVELVAAGRPAGDGYELELSAVRPG